MLRLNRMLILITVAIFTFTTVASGSASIPIQAAKHAIAKHAYQLTISTGADHFSVTGCFRISTHRVACYVTVYRIPTQTEYVDCSFYSHAFWQGTSRKIHLGDTKPACRRA